MTRLETLIAGMRANLTAQCRLVKAGLLVLGESAAGPERDAVREALLAQGQAQREACRRYNNLRACMGRMELAAGNPEPRFYAGDFVPSDELPIKGCDCGIFSASRHGDAAKLDAHESDLDGDDGQTSQNRRNRGEEQAVRNGE